MSGTIRTLSLVLLAVPGSVQGAASLRPDGLLDIDGQPIFPVGLVELGTYRYPDWAERIRESGANFVWDIEIAYADTTPSCDAVLAAAEAGGWYLLAGSGDTWNWDDPSTPGLEVDQRMYEPAELDALLDCAASHPGRLAAFANRDEPSWTLSRGMIGDIDEAHIRDTYAQLRVAAPHSLVAMNHAPAQIDGDLEQWKTDLQSFAGATDVMMFASYPYPPGEGTCGEFNVLGYPECTMDRLAVAADLFLSEINLPGQPLWMIVQAHKGIPLKESRWEAWASVVHGATGVFWAGWTWDHILGGGEQNWPITRQVMSEVSALQPFLVGDDLPGAESGEPNVDVRALAGRGGEAILVAVARNAFQGSAALRLPAWSRGGAQVLHEGRDLPVSDGWITDSFDGYEAHVYRYAVRRTGPEPGPLPEGGVPDARADRTVPRLATSPNPSEGPVRIRFDLPRGGAATFAVFDATGRRVATAASGRYPSGPGEVVWNGRDAAGSAVAPGVYFVRVRTDAGTSAAARVLIRR